MADNVAITPGAGATIATDDVAGVQYQRAKLAFGADGAATDVNTGAGLPVSDAGGSLTVDGSVTVSGTVTANAGTGTLAVSAAALPLPSGAATAAKQPALGTAGAASTDVITVQGIASGVAQAVSGTVAATQSGTWTVQPGNTANTTAWKVDGSAVTQPVSGSVTANPGTVSTASVPAQVAGSATSVTLLASNGSRKGAIFVNDSTAILYVKFGTTASTTSYTYKLAAGDTLEIPTRPVYTGRIDGIWASATGAAAITEL